MWKSCSVVLFNGTDQDLRMFSPSVFEYHRSRAVVKNFAELIADDNVPWTRWVITINILWPDIRFALEAIDFISVVAT